MRTQKACFLVGAKVRVSQRHRIVERRGMVGRVVGRYGGEGYVAVEVRFCDGRRRLFWPGDLEEIASAARRPLLLRCVVGGASRG